MHLPRFAIVNLPSRSSNRYIFYGVLVGLALSLTTTSVVSYFQQRKRKRTELTFEPRPIELRSDDVVHGVTGLIGTLDIAAFTICTSPNLYWRLLLPLTQVIHR